MARVQWQARRGVTAFADLLIDRMEAEGTRPRDLVRWLGLSSNAVSRWFNPGTVPRDATLLELARVFGDPPELWLKAAGRSLPPGITPERYAEPRSAPPDEAQAPLAPSAGGRRPMNRYARAGAGRVQQTPAQAIAEDRAAIEQNPFYPEAVRKALLSLIDSSLESAYDTSGVTDLSPVLGPTDEQETRTLDVGPAGRVPPQRQPLPPGRRGTHPEPAPSESERDTERHENTRRGPRRDA